MGKRFLNKLSSKEIVKPFETKERIILRDYLAMQRTTLANERTLFAYIRTSLYLILGGIGLLKLEDFRELIWLGYFSLGLSIVVIVYGLIRYWILRRRLNGFYDAIGIEEFEESHKG